MCPLLCLVRAAAWAPFCSDSEGLCGFPLHARLCLLPLPCLPCQYSWFDDFLCVRPSCTSWVSWWGSLIGATHAGGLPHFWGGTGGARCGPAPQLGLDGAESQGWTAALPPCAPWPLDQPLLQFGALLAISLWLKGHPWERWHLGTSWWPWQSWGEGELILEAFSNPSNFVILQVAPQELRRNWGALADPRGCWGDPRLCPWMGG